MIGVYRLTTPPELENSTVPSELELELEHGLYDTLSMPYEIYEIYIYVLMLSTVPIRT